MNDINVIYSKDINFLVFWCSTSVKPMLFSEMWYLYNDFVKEHWGNMPMLPQYVYYAMFHIITWRLGVITCIRNEMGEITFPFPNFNSCTIEVWLRINNLTP